MYDAYLSTQIEDGAQPLHLLCGLHNKVSGGLLSPAELGQSLPGLLHLRSAAKTISSPCHTSAKSARML